MCKAIDGVTLYMQTMRSGRGQAPVFTMSETDLAANLDSGSPIYDPPDNIDGRGSFGNLQDVAHPVTAPGQEGDVLEAGERLDGRGISVGEGPEGDALALWDGQTGLGHRGVGLGLPTQLDLVVVAQAQSQHVLQGPGEHIELGDLHGDSEGGEAP